MKRNINTLYALASIIILAFTSCHDDDFSILNTNDDAVFQVSTLQSLMDGGYDGTITISELKTNGNIGLGTFDHINGEMIVFNDTVFQALWDGSVIVANDTTTVPFADVATFSADKPFNAEEATDMADLSAKLDSVLQEFGQDNIFIVKMDAHCQDITVRSEVPQTPPYSPLLEVLPTAERSFFYEDISGTFVAMWFPEAFATVSGSGWHYHFISNNRKQGGHVLSINGLSNLNGSICVRKKLVTII